MAPVRDANSVYRVVTIVTTHPTSWEAAVVAGVEELTKSITDLRVARVVELDTAVRDGEINAYRAKLQVSFRVDPRRMVAGRVQTVQRCLVVVNRTAGSPELTEAVRKRVAKGPTELYVLVPARLPALASTALMGEPLTGYSAFDSAEVVEARDSARKEANQRLADQLEELDALNPSSVRGEVSVSDPLSAVATVLGRAAFDEIIVSTLPASVSRWVRMDLPHRLHRRFGLPVTHVEEPG
jgi:flavin-binding protein dodecin